MRASYKGREHKAQVTIGSLGARVERKRASSGNQRNGRDKGFKKRIYQRIPGKIKGDKRMV